MPAMQTRKGKERGSRSVGVHDPFQLAMGIVGVRQPATKYSRSSALPGFGRSGYGGATPYWRGERPGKETPTRTAQRALRFDAGRLAN